MEIKAKSARKDDLRAFLEAERARLLREMARADLTLDDETAGYSNHMAEGASEVFEQAKSAGMKRSQELKLAEVEDALRRMDEGSYGICRRCGAAIDAARLRAMPTAALCLSCQERAEETLA
jgi:RNA polymerase-binding protein DksA